MKVVMKKTLRTEGGQERLDNLAELKQSIYEFETTCGEEVTLEQYLSQIALLSILMLSMMLRIRFA